MDPLNSHPVHLIQLFDADDEIDVEVVTDQPHVFSITFKEPRTILAVAIEPARIPFHESLETS